MKLCSLYVNFTFCVQFQLNNTSEFCQDLTRQVKILSAQATAVLLRQNVKTTKKIQVKAICNVSVQAKQAKHCLNQLNTRFQMKTIFLKIFAITSASVKSATQSSSNMYCQSSNHSLQIRWQYYLFHNFNFKTYIYIVWLVLILIHTNIHFFEEEKLCIFGGLGWKMLDRMQVCQPNSIIELYQSLVVVNATGR